MSVDTSVRSVVVVDFLYLDAVTCQRCVNTGDALDEAMGLLTPVFEVVGVHATVNRIHVATRADAERHRFLSSPTIRVDDVDICTDVRESPCADCGDLAGYPTNCRVFVWHGQDYEQPPAGMIVDGVLRALYGPAPEPADGQFVLPENLINFFNGRTINMKTIHVFEPALCCNTGVCGPDPAQELVTFTADLDHLKGLGADITRHNLANDPGAFAEAAPVRAFLEVAGSDGLPLTLVDGVVALTGRYPSRAELLRYSGLDAEAPASGCGCGCGDAKDQTSTCCSGDAKDQTASSDCGCGDAKDQTSSTCCSGDAKDQTASSDCGCGSNCDCDKPASEPVAAAPASASACGCGSSTC